MNETVAIIQARMRSTRLPGKVLKDLMGKPMLAHVIERATAIPGVSKVVVATSSDPDDGPIVDLAKELGIGAFTGSHDDVLDRYYQAARTFGADVIMRLTADCPMLDPSVCGSVLARYACGDVDYVSNVHPASFPDGLDTEVFSFTAVEQAWREATLRSEREHVTPYIWNHPTKFRLGNVANGVDLSQHRWTVDEPRDLDLVRLVYSRLHRDGRPPFGMADVLALLSSEDSILSINAGIARNEGYSRSLSEDRNGTAR